MEWRGVLTYECSPIKRKQEEPLMLIGRYINSLDPYDISIFCIRLQQGMIRFEDVAKASFDLYCEKKVLQGNVLNELLFLFYSNYPFLNSFKSFLQRNRKIFYLTQDEWVSLFVEREYILSCGDASDKQMMNWPLLFEDFKTECIRQTTMQCF
ncbi:hypothetical protein EIN_079020 [Entamoeba invadens IP1]|uniref:hypothetical protein n=1 Tax=Entamoeba invadens IP1 TaxID=370355 RepID=UPI0002C3F2FF|nr:hypothetical protein EIN_079020 [Entamoeba invadens IP1]ELP85000.1 hypothetical protein EIN_079020 [Entamoeba invadens IP1]|eukprot:XP_004184346.1 hypothetical protein EIN_079020 [Entamoeba invadens IP1]